MRADIHLPQSSTLIQKTLDYIWRLIVEHAGRALNLQRGDLMSRPSVIGVGRSDRSDAEAAVIIYVDRSAGPRPQLPRSLEGLCVRVIETDSFVAF